MYTNQMYQQQPYNPGFGGGVNYAQQMPQAKMTQPLSKEEINELRRKTGGFSIQIPEIEFVRAKCTHKENGNITLLDNNDGTVTCSICQETFRIIDCNPEEAAQITESFVDLFQTIKTYFLDIPETYISAIADILPIVKQIPELYKLALNNFNRQENGFNGLNQRGQIGGFNLLNGLLSPGGYGQPQYQQPYAQPAYGQQQYQQPYTQPAYDQQQYQQPQQQYQQPVTNGFGYNAQQPIVGQQGGHDNQTVTGGSGVGYTKENAVPVKSAVTEKVFNN